MTNYFRFQHSGINFNARIVPDDMMLSPWKAHSCYGTVSEWTRRAKRHGERVLAQEKGHFLYWTPAETTPDAVRSDFARLRGWIDGDWHWIGVVVDMLDTNGNVVPGYAGSIWGIESDSPDYHKEVAQELATELAGKVGDVSEICLTIR